jgi:hypothetical protein
MKYALATLSLIIFGFISVQVKAQQPEATAPSYPLPPSGPGFYSMVFVPSYDWTASQGGSGGKKHVNAGVVIMQGAYPPTIGGAHVQPAQATFCEIDAEHQNELRCSAWTVLKPNLIPLPPPPKEK